LILSGRIVKEHTARVANLFSTAKRTAETIVVSGSCRENLCRSEMRATELGHEISRSAIAVRKEGKMSRGNIQF
jgi:hypothetical protein